jgi:predicted nuclease with TOPRIM domain
MRAAMAQHISDIKTEQLAQRGLLQALGQTQGEQNARSVRVEGKLMGIDDRLTTLTGRVVGMDDRLTNVENRLGGVETRLDRVEQGLGTVQVGVQTIIAILDRQIDEQPEAAGN